MPCLAHEVAGDGDECIPAQPDHHRALGPDALAEFAEEQREGNADKLGEEQRPYQVHRADANFRPVDRRHLDDGADAVIVEPEGDEELEELAIFADLGERYPQPFEAGFDGSGPCLDAGFVGRGLRNVSQQRDGENAPPERHGEQGEPVAQVVGRQEPDHSDVDGEQDAAAKIAQCIPLGRDEVGVLFFGDVPQQRVVEDVRGPQPDRPEEEQHQREYPIPRIEGEHQRRGEDADAGKDGQELFLAAGIVGDAPQDGSQDGPYQQGDGIGVSPVDGCLIGAQVRGDDRTEVDRQDGSFGGRRKGGAAPVVHTPGVDYFLILTFSSGFDVQVMFSFLLN